MERSFYQFALKYRGKLDADDYSRFADAMFLDIHFLKQHRISSGFPNTSKKKRIQS